jgi:hypothetical protein
MNSIAAEGCYNYNMILIINEAFWGVFIKLYLSDRFCWHVPANFV